MSFELFTPGTMRGSHLTTGQCSIAKTGITRFCEADLARMGIKHQAVVYVDRALFRIAIQKPRRDDDGKLPPTVAVKTGKGSPTISLGPAIRAIGLDTEKVAGPHEATFKDNLLIICLK